MAEFTNPNQAGPGGGGQDNRSLVLMLIVMVGVFFGLQYYRQKTAPATPAKPAVTQSAPATNPTAVAPPPAAMQAPSASDQPASGVVAGTTPAIQAPAEATTVVENELYKITFSNRGAQVTSWILKTQKDTNGKPLDLIHQQVAQAFGRPLSLFTYDPAVTAALNSALYVPSATGALPAPASLSFHYAANGLDVTKTFTFDETYLIHADVVTNAERRAGTCLTKLARRIWRPGQPDLLCQRAARHDAQRQGRPPRSEEGREWRYSEWPNRVGWRERHVLRGDLPAGLAFDRVAGHAVEPDRRGEDHSPHWLRRVTGSSDKPVMVPVVGAAIGDTSGHTETRIYVGPKLVNVLRNIHVTGSKETLAPLLDFGFFGPIGKYLFLALQWIHSTITLNWNGSWGWAIVILTVAINLLILPLRVKTMQSGLKMQRISPQMDAIKARYAKYKVTDPKRNEMNAEIMQLQKDNGVNMFGGCIPTLIQMPLLFAFFGMLPKVVELRHASWFWLPDLTAADPHHILPILMVVSQFLVQFYTPSPGVDPQQQKMMAFMMPAVSGYMTWSYASGLALYWSVGNLIGIAQQAVMNRTSLGREMREIAAKRARRKSGSGAASGKVIPGRR